ncbi:MAG: DUF1223 domain-containing protein [Zhongshania sp.]|uniref:DUF1223 domain-containing protein n=1 Tax=Zhongshania sp. TaxID=1971902 RepID=UPI00262A0D2D|nr:DUF1223 domain-containing protein [Zhongshania sp.]MDF1691373.1 DUF1223 domain-containing protein [Zhongshania sp.]
MNMRGAVATLLCVLATANAQSLELRSATMATATIELYTSEGCSSCPPADVWLSSLKYDPQLFTRFIPMAFHVDYWNQLGWRDRFSAAAYSTRQRQMQAHAVLSQVYTPGFVVNNAEWRGWFKRGSKPSAAQLVNPNRDAGVLTALWESPDDFIAVDFKPQVLADKSLWANIAILGMGLTTQVQRGENSGRTLAHDFVVLSLERQPLAGDISDSYSARFKPPSIPERGQQQSVLVVWVSAGNSPAIVQAVAGILE